MGVALSLPGPFFVTFGGGGRRRRGHGLLWWALIGPWLVPVLVVLVWPTVAALWLTWQLVRLLAVAVVVAVTFLGALARGGQQDDEAPPAG